MTAPYTDHHVHLMATVAARLSVDLSAARSIGEIGHIIRSAGGTGWVRAWGYEEWCLHEGRHPTRADLDRALPGRPLVVHHRSGHAAVLNSAALSELGELDHPDGILVDRHDLLSRVPRLHPAAMEAAARSVSREWADVGVTAVVDATHTNGADELQLFARWCAGGVVLQEVTAMVSSGAVGSVPPFAASVGPVTVGHVKLMPTAAGRFGVGGLDAAVASAHARGYPVAVHVVDIEVLDVTLGALERSPAPPGTRDRIEHNALSLPEHVDRIAACGAAVVVNPAFLLWRRGKYEAELGEVERGWLVRMGSLVRAGVSLRAGSDAPVTPSRPLEILAAARAHPFAPGESLTAEQAAELLAP